MKLVDNDVIHSEPLCSRFRPCNSSYRTLAEAFAATVQRLPDQPFVGSYENGKERWITYSEADRLAWNLGSQLICKGLLRRKAYPEETQPLATIGIYSNNCPEWFVVEQMCSKYGATLVPLYDTLGREATVFIIDQAQVDTLVVSSAYMRSAVEFTSASQCKNLVVIGSATQSDLVEAGECGLTVYFIADLWAAAVDVEPSEVTASTISTLCYTSGTTGQPKGVKISHQNMLACMDAMFGVLASIPEHIKVDPSMVHFSYLPLPHVLEHIITGAVWLVGGRIVCFSGDRAQLLKELSQARPDFFVAVPRVLSKISNEISKAVNSRNSLLKYLIQRWIRQKEEALHEEPSPSPSLVDSFLYRKFRSFLGGNVKFIVVGGAPLDSQIWYRTKGLFGVPVMQGYGMTEVCGVAFVQHPAAVRCNVGLVVPGLECRLESVEEMEYCATNTTKPTGEVQIRGPAVFAGYLSNPKASAEIVDADGWLHTGDIGCLEADECLEIVDRRKAIFKLSQGEYVAPEKIENVYANASSVDQIFVYGSQVADYLVGVVVLAKSIRDEYTSQSSLETLVERELHEEADRANLKGFERVRKIHITREPFTVDNCLLTPTAKLRRHAAEQRYRSVIDRLYAQE
ncbi:MAG: uncharacterized protein KVP18_004485 [Porospora cf. gigantea A]|uniref:uncharacterized protein n=1 Tax=Porospora cf. gigantea A TaxID=2853593 RepID=UPI003559ABC6|nr:MAG: hypothetical protein KVP18_004485 [Porospora cf. gigantea A]